MAWRHLTCCVCMSCVLLCLRQGNVLFHDPRVLQCWQGPSPALRAPRSRSVTRVSQVEDALGVLELMLGDRIQPDAMLLDALPLGDGSRWLTGLVSGSLDSRLEGAVSRNFFQGADRILALMKEKLAPGRLRSARSRKKEASGARHSAIEHDSGCLCLAVSSHARVAVMRSGPDLEPCKVSSCTLPGARFTEPSASSKTWCRSITFSRTPMCQSAAVRRMDWAPSAQVQFREKASLCSACGF